MPPTINELLDRAERLAEHAVRESAEDDPAILLNAAGKGWNAANLSMIAVIDHFTHHRPKGTDTRRHILQDLTREHSRSRFPVFLAMVESMFADLHLRAEEQAEYSAKILRRRLEEVRSKLVPLARELIRQGFGRPARHRGR